MSTIYKCDICGKSQDKVKFDIRPIKLQIPNHKKQKINIYLNVMLEHDTDTKLLEQLSTEHPLEEIYDAISAGDIKLKLPYPSVCIKCKREMIKLALAYGKEEKIEVF